MMRVELRILSGQQIKQEIVPDAGFLDSKSYSCLLLVLFATSQLGKCQIIIINLEIQIGARANRANYQKLSKYIQYSPRVQFLYEICPSAQIRDHLNFPLSCAANLCITIVHSKVL